MNQLAGLPLSEGDSLHGLAGTASVITYTVFGLSLSGSGVLAQGQLGTATKRILPGPVDISLIVLANTSGTAVTGVALAINGSSATAGNQILSGATIPANGQLVLSGDGVLRVYDATGNVYQTAATPFGTSGLASTVAASAAIVDAEAQVVGVTLPANFMAAGTTFRITAVGKVTTLATPGDDVFKVRIGSATLTGDIAATVTAAAVASITGQDFYLQFLVTVRTAGASGTVVGQGIVWSFNATTGAFTALNIIGITTSAVAVDTTVANVLELTAITGAADSSLTFQTAAIESVRQ